MRSLKWSTYMFRLKKILPIYENQFWNYKLYNLSDHKTRWIMKFHSQNVLLNTNCLKLSFSLNSFNVLALSFLFGHLCKELSERKNSLKVCQYKKTSMFNKMPSEKLSTIFSAPARNLGSFNLSKAFNWKFKEQPVSQFQEAEVKLRLSFQIEWRRENAMKRMY